MSAAAQLEVQPYSVVRRPSDAGFIVGLTYFAPLALLPLYLQDLVERAFGLGACALTEAVQLVGERREAA